MLRPTRCASHRASARGRLAHCPAPLRFAAHRSADVGRDAGAALLVRTGILALLLFAALGGGHAAEVTFTLSDAKNQPTGDAVVSLVPLDSAPPDLPAAEIVDVEQKNQEFAPYVTAIRAGAAVRFPNRDTIEHHAYSESAVRRFELPLYKPGRAETIVFPQPGVVSIGCNIHDWMLAYVLVLPTPWFAVAPAGGTVVLKNIPSGRYRADVWHPRLAKTESREVTVPEGSTPVALAFRLALKPDRRVRRATNAAGRTYR